MKIEPVKNYRKPGYAMKIASIIAAAGSLAGCTSAQLSGDVSMVTDDAKTTTEELQLAGETDTDCTETKNATSSKTSQTTVKTTATTTEPMLDGDIAIIDESETTPAQTTAVIRSKQTTGITETTTELKLGGVLTTAATTAATAKLTTSRTTTATTEPEFGGATVTTTARLTTPGDVVIPAETTTEVTTAGVPPVYTETTEVTLAGEPVLPME